MARQNDHTQAVDLISAYLDKQVTAQEQQFLEQHLSACAECRAQLEMTRSMLTALRAMPAMKAPRSFVLPREMARPPKRSILSWYPALRLATAVAVVAFIVVFAGDILTSRPGSVVPLSVPASAPAPRAMAEVTEPTESAAAQDAAQSTTMPAAASAMAEPLATAPAGEISPKVAMPTEAAVLASTTEAAMEKTAASTATPEALSATAGGVVAQSNAPLPDEAATNMSPEPQAAVPAVPIDPLRVIEIALLGLIVALGAATFIARRSTS